MSKFLNSFKVSFSKGILTGILDILFRLLVAFVWFMVVRVVVLFAWEAITLPQLAGQRMWWLSYSALILLIVSVLGYTAIFSRE